MKKQYLCLVMLLLLPMGLLANKATRDSLIITDTPMGVHPWKNTAPLAEDFAHWSLTLEGGLSLIDGDFHQPNITIIPITRVRPTGAVSLIYDFTTQWSLRGRYAYGNYGVEGTEKGTGEKTNVLFGHMHTLELLAGYNLANAFFPNRKTNVFNVSLLAGLGMGFYDSKFQHDGVESHPRADGKYDMTGVITLGLEMDWNVSRCIGIGLNGFYHIYTTDLIDGHAAGQQTDCMEYANLFIRFKLQGKSKNHLHNFANEGAFALRQKPEKDTLVIIEKDTVVLTSDTVIMQTVQTAPAVEVKPLEQRFYCYFDNDKFDLTDASLRTLQQVSVLLAEDSTLCLSITGYTDNTASERYNKTLAQRRADRVSKELKSVYGIDASRIAALGAGMLTNVKGAYSANRRVEIRLIDREQVQKLQQQVQENQAVAQVQEPADKQEQDPVLATVQTVKDRTTLARLARKYYRNPFCWVYIYEANQDVLHNPDFIPEGLTLRIPRLTEEQMDRNNAASMQYAQQLAEQYKIQK